MNVVLPNIANRVSEILSRQQFIKESERSRETLNLCSNVDHHRDQRSLYSIKFDDLVEDLTQDAENQYQNTGLQVVSTLSCDLGNVMKIGNKVGATETLEKNLNENQLSLTTNLTLVHIDDDGQNNAATIMTSTIDDGQQLNGTRGDVVLIGKSGHHWQLTQQTNSIALMNAKNTCKGVELVHESNWAVVTKKKSPSIEIGSPIRNTVQPVVDSQTMNSGAREIVSKEEQQGATSTPRWENIADEEEEQESKTERRSKLLREFLRGQKNGNQESDKKVEETEDGKTEGFDEGEAGGNPLGRKRKRQDDENGGSEINIKSGGPVVREWQQKLLVWQLAHPSGSAEECLDWMKHARTE
ncbi:hypothetical protein KY289_009555 [Solanum tuberosum]|nr:hypothetical protein KY289_009555 [Solanum tuberosum]